MRLMILAAVFLSVQDVCLAMPPRKNKNNRDPNTSLQFIVSTDVFLNVDLDGVAKIDCSVNDPNNVQFNLFYTPTLTQPAVERPVQENKLTLQSGIYNLANIHMEEFGHYNCYAQRGQEKIVKNFTIVPSPRSFVALPIITPKQVTVTSGDDLKLTCTCWNDRCTLDWKVREHNGGPINDINVKLNIITNYQFSKRELDLSLKNIKRPLEITCTSQYKGEKNEASLEVLKVPSIVSLPDKVSVNKGSSIEIECVATGLPSPNILWTKDYQIIQDCERTKVCQNKKSNYRISGNYEQKLKIINANVEYNSGTYGCHAVSLYGMDETRTEVVVVERTS